MYIVHKSSWAEYEQCIESISSKVSTSSLNSMCMSMSSVGSISMSSRSRVASGSSEVSEQLATASPANHHPSTHTSCHHHRHHRQHHHQGEGARKQARKLQDAQAAQLTSLRIDPLGNSFPHNPVFSWRASVIVCVFVIFVIIIIKITIFIIIIIIVTIIIIIGICSVISTKHCF